MTIEKKGTVYTINETKTGWKLNAIIDNIHVSFNVSKADCPTFESLQEFVAENEAI